MDYKIVIASTNKGKIDEISKILNSLERLNIDARSLLDYNIAEPDEPYDCFLKNAIHKVKYYAKYTKEATLAEDSGLSIEALNGFPGVRSKNLIEECGGVSNAFKKLEILLAGSKNNTAYFTSATALYIPSHDFLITHEAKDYGSISFPPRGDDGFGFDPIFIPKGYDKTFAELGVELKNKISHRAKSMRGLIEKLQDFFASHAA